MLIDIISSMSFKKSISFVGAMLLLKSTVSFGQQEVGCFVPGECLQSLFLEVNATETPQQCLEFCQVKKCVHEKSYQYKEAEKNQNRNLKSGRSKLKK